MSKRACSIWFLLLTATHASANTAVYSGSGFTVKLEKNAKLQLVSEEISITPITSEHDVELGKVPDVNYDCRFNLRNLSNEAVTAQVGMPVDFAIEGVYRFEGETRPQKKMLEYYRFRAEAGENRFQPRFARGDGGGSRKYNVFVWNMTFAPHETQNLHISYRVPMSFGGASTEINWGTDDNLHKRCPICLEFTGAYLFWLTYVTETGKSWKGLIEKATFRVNCSQFQANVNRIGIAKMLSLPEPFSNRKPSPDDKDDTELLTDAGDMRRFALPAGWHETERGLEWTFSNFKPGPDFVVRFYWPLVPQSVPVLQKALGRLEHRTAAQAHRNLVTFRELLLATFGKPPSSPEVQAFCERQMWYEPRKDFTIDKLTPVQKTMLEYLDSEVDRKK